MGRGIGVGALLGSFAGRLCMVWSGLEWGELTGCLLGVCCLCVVLGLLMLEGRSKFGC